MTKSGEGNFFQGLPQPPTLGTGLKGSKVLGDNVRHIMFKFGVVNELGDGKF